MKLAKGGENAFINRILLIVPRAISTFSRGNETNIIRLRKKDIKIKDSVVLVIMTCIPFII